MMLPATLMMLDEITFVLWADPRYRQLLESTVSPEAGTLKVTLPIAAARARSITSKLVTIGTPIMAAFLGVDEIELGDAEEIQQALNQKYPYSPHPAELYAAVLIIAKTMRRQLLNEQRKELIKAGLNPSELDLVITIAPEAEQTNGVFKQLESRSDETSHRGISQGIQEAPAFANKAFRKRQEHSRQLAQDIDAPEEDVNRILQYVRTMGWLAGQRLTVAEPPPSMPAYPMHHPHNILSTDFLWKVSQFFPGTPTLIPDISPQTPFRGDIHTKICMELVASAKMVWERVEQGTPYLCGVVVAGLGLYHGRISGGDEGYRQVAHAILNYATGAYPPEKISNVLRRYCTFETKEVSQ